MGSGEIVITGLGVVSPPGIGVDPLWTSVREQRSSVRPLTLFDASQLPVRFGGEIRNFDGKEYIRPRKSLKVMCREIQFGFVAAELALRSAAIEPKTIDPERIGVVFGTELFYGEIGELETVYRNCIVDGQFQFSRWGDRFASDIFPLWMLKYLPNMIACHLAIAYEAHGPNNTINLGEASSLLSIIEALDVIHRGAADVMVAGGAGSRLNITPMMYRGHRLLSRRNENPELACRPFDAGRDGMVNGEGAGAVILERAEHAAARGAPVLARILGVGRGFRAQPNEASAAAATEHSLRVAITKSGLSSHEIGHVNAHGVSTLEGDRMEAQAISRVLPDTPVTAPKSYFGNLGAGSGAIELILSILAIREGEIPVTLNYDVPDPACPVDVVCRQPRRDRPPTAVKLNQSGTGQTVAMVIAGA